MLSTTTLVQYNETTVKAKRTLNIVLLDIRSAHNVGSIMRSADGFSASITLVGITPRPKGTESDDRLPHIVAKLDKSIAKTALGAEKSVSWKYFPDIGSANGYLKSNNYSICALEQHKSSKPLSAINADFSDKNIALIVGPEVTGIPNEILKVCDKVYEIPMTGKKESFNVSVAAAIALYQLRQ